ncbi:hypothetical protein N7528_009718 [Penicillium herquei]|nr:hypothetical protein N7528_009718 [Penicillium herquei]
MANSPIKQRKASHSSSTSSVISNISQPQPWLNERLLRAFDEPLLPDLLLPTSSPQANEYNPGGTGHFDCMVHVQNPNIVFDQMLHNLGNTLEIGEFESETPSLCHNVSPGHIEALETDILSPEARAQLQIASELEKFPSGNWWESWPSAPMSDGLITPYSSISSPMPCFPELSVGSAIPIDPLLSDSALLEDPFSSMMDASLLNSVFGPSSRQDSQQSSATRSSDTTPGRKSGRKFTFIYEHPGARTGTQQ